MQDEPADHDTNLFRHEPDATPYGMGAAIFAEGDDGEHAFVVQSGEVELAINGHLVEVVGEGGIFGEMALVERKPRSATATARTDVKLVEIDQQRVLDIISNSPFFAI